MSTIKHLKIAMSTSTKPLEQGCKAATGGLNKVDYAATKALQTLQNSIASFGKSGAAAESYALKTKGVSNAIISQTYAANKQLQKLQESARAKQALARATDQLQRELEQEATALKKLVQTPIEKYVASMKRLQQINKAGLLSPQDFARARGKIVAELKAVEDAAKKSLGNVRKSGDSLLTTFAKVGIAIYAVRTAFNAIKSVVGTPLQLAANYESASIALTTMVKSQAKANTLLDQWEKYAIASPFDSAGVIQSGKMLLSYSSDISQVTNELKMLGDIAAGSGSDLSELAYLYGTSRTQVKLMSKDLYQFSAKSVPIISMLADQFGVVESEIFKMAESGQLNFGHLQTVLKKLTSEGGLYYKATDKQSKGLQGMWNALSEEATKSARYIGEAMVKGWDLKAALASLTEFTIALREDYFPVVQAVIMQGKQIFDYWTSWGTYINQASSDTDSFIGKLTAVYSYIKAVADYLPSNMLASAITSSFADNLEKARAEAKQVKKEMASLGMGKAAATISQASEATDQLTQQLDDLRSRANSVWSEVATPMDNYRDKWVELNDLYQQGAINLDLFTAANEKAFKSAMGYENNSFEAYEATVKNLTAQMQSGLIDYSTFDKKRDEARESQFGVSTDDIKTYKGRIEELRQAWVKGFITDDQFKDSKLAALPDIVKSAIDDAKTPLQKFNEQVGQLKKYKDAGLLDGKQFAKAQAKLKIDLLGGGNTAQTMGSLATRGSQESYQAILQNRFGASANPQKEMLKEQKHTNAWHKKEERHLARIAKALESQQGVDVLSNN